jgi:hypothetical protein
MIAVFVSHVLPPATATATATVAFHFFVVSLFLREGVELETALGHLTFLILGATLPLLTALSVLLCFSYA